MQEETKKNSVGRPLKFDSVEELKTLIDNYFKKCDKEKRPYTITGLAIALDTVRSVLLDYESKDEFSNTIKKAKAKCENFAEERLFGGGQVAGPIFNLKNNYKNWKDKQEIDQNVKIENYDWGNYNKGDGDNIKDNAKDKKTM